MAGRGAKHQIGMVSRCAQFDANDYNKGVMKFVILGKKRAQQGGKLENLPCTTLESLTRLSGVPHQARTCSELCQQIHDDLRIQHPEWIQPNGESPMCDAYEARLMDLLDPLMRNADDQSLGGPNSTPGHGLN